MNFGDTEADSNDFGIPETPLSTKNEKVTPVGIGIGNNITRSPVDTVKRNMTGSLTSCRCNPQVLHNIQSLLMEINTKVDKLAKQPPSEANEKENNIFEKSQILFPVSNKDGLKQLESFLSVTENYKAMVLYFARMGGVNIYDFVKRCLGLILANELATQYSYIGRKGKKRFCDLFLSKALVESSERAGTFKDRRETEMSIGCWLRKAKERSTRSTRNQP